MQGSNHSDAAALALLEGLKSKRITADLIVNAVIGGIEDGTLKTGAKFVSTREIADHLGISRTTVMKAFESLIARGYLSVRHGSGAWLTSPHGPVAANKSLSSSNQGSSAFDWSRLTSQLARNLDLQAAEHIMQADFDEINFGSVSPEHLPIAAWRKGLANLEKTLQSIDFSANQEVFGYRPLRQAIADYLGRSGKLQCTADQVVIGSGVQNVIGQALQLLIKSGDRVICENPGFWGARDQITSLGGEPIPVGIDNEGLKVSDLDQIQNQMQEHAQWIYVAPSCQEPTGVVLSQARKQQLIEWANTNNTAIFEDDWDSEFQYLGSTTSSLFSQDQTGSVIYFSSFWRLLYPLSSVSFLVLPADSKLQEVFKSYKTIWERQFTLLEHIVLTEILNGGHLETKMRATWKLYRKQRQALIFALKKSFGNDIEISQSNTGGHVIVRAKSDTLANLLAANNGGGSPLVFQSTAPYYFADRVKNEYMVPFTHLDADKTEALVAELAARL